MGLEYDVMIYLLVKLAKILEIKLSAATEKYLSDTTDISLANMKLDDKTHYASYAVQILENLAAHVGKIREIDIDDNSDLVVRYGSRREITVSVDYSTLAVSNLIPRNLMRVCCYSKNSNIYKQYMENYNALNDKYYRLIRKHDNYSQIKEKVRNEMLESFVDLFLDTLSKKKKCAQNLYDGLFREKARILFKFHVKRLSMYDFQDPYIEAITSYKLERLESNRIQITFNNGAVFHLTLTINSSKIQPILSLKYNVRFQNLGEMFRVNT